jgi:hypothetical protein
MLTNEVLNTYRCRKYHVNCYVYEKKNASHRLQGRTVPDAAFCMTFSFGADIKTMEILQSTKNSFAITTSSLVPPPEIRTEIYDIISRPISKYIRTSAFEADRGVQAQETQDNNCTARGSYKVESEHVTCETEATLGVRMDNFACVAGDARNVRGTAPEHASKTTT